MLIITAMIALPACRPSEASSHETSRVDPQVAQRIQFSPIEAAENASLVMLPAEVVLPPHAHQALAPPMTGRLTEWSVEVGQKISVGDVLGVLLTPSFSELDAQVREQERVVSHRRQLLQKKKTHVSSGMQPIQSIYDDEFALAEARARLASLKKQRAAEREVVELQPDSNRWRWQAQGSGVVQTTRCLVGSTLGSDTPCLELVNTDEALLRVRLPERYVERVDEALTLKWYPTSTIADPIEMRFVRREPMIDPSSHTLAVYFEPMTPKTLLVGSTGRSVLSVAVDSKLLKIPESAVTQLDGQYIIFVSTEDPHVPGRPESITIEGRAEDALLARSDALNVGDQIATQGVFLLKSMALMEKE